MITGQVPAGVTNHTVEVLCACKGYSLSTKESFRLPCKVTTIALLETQRIDADKQCSSCLDSELRFSMNDAWPIYILQGHNGYTFDAFVQCYINAFVGIAHARAGGMGYPFVGKYERIAHPLCAGYSPEWASALRRLFAGTVRLYLSLLTGLHGFV
jgi:hypothetical protein